MQNRKVAEGDETVPDNQYAENMGEDNSSDPKVWK